MRLLIVGIAVLLLLPAASAKHIDNPTHVDLGAVECTEDVDDHNPLGRDGYVSCSSYPVCPVTVTVQPRDTHVQNGCVIVQALT